MEKTLTEARDRFFKELDVGGTCPCCGRYGKKYQRQITGAMAYGLIVMSREPAETWIHIDSFMAERATFLVRGMLPLLRFWGLLEAADGEKDDGNPNTGRYRVTETGHDFVNFKNRIPKYANLYNNTLYGFSGGLITIKDALGKKFNYAEIMGLPEQREIFSEHTHG